MAQMVRSQSGGEGGDEILGQDPTPIAPAIGRSTSQEEDQNQPLKKSILMKVKEKARKLRNTLSKKKHEDVTLPGSVSREEKEEENPEYHEAPMRESELAPEAYNVTAKRNQAAPLVIPKRDVLVPEKMLAPANATVSKVKIQSPPVAAAATGSESSSEQKCDKEAVTMKEYLMQKLEPGENEKVLSQVISEAISPTTVGPNGEMGMVDKVKGVVSSLLRVEEQSKIPVSTNPREVEIEGPHEKILQTN
ncbi:uncharacterized protein LOC131252825 isoform X2 [Magnolia sinica]|uniref:uncharacterized protein LOC131252825 isoform X2 n=1 Tax=Magnolia sinica TaxID=86752 RepID=UPI00265A6692|nr:uncharacterized protein LOC131252825 isoform X2 [Magnolia sinica]